MYKNRWLFHEIKNKKLELGSFVKATTNSKSNPENVINPFAWNGTGFVTGHSTFVQIMFELPKAFIAYKYKLFIKKGYRYMMNWVFEGRNKNLSYSTLHSGKNQCNETASGSNCDKNCKYDTETEYVIENPRFFNSFMLRMTSLDSCDTYRMRVFGIDIYGYFLYKTYNYVKNSACVYLIVFLLLIATVEC